MREETLAAETDVFVRNTLSKYGALLKKLRRSFEALRQENLWLRRQPSGDVIDIDAVVEAFTDNQVGHEPSDRLYLQTRRLDRSVAVMFLVDMSASTAGWINRLERESLVLMCESLEILGDPYAIYGFSGRNHTDCRSYHVKAFDEFYNAEIRRRIGGIGPHAYTRLGAAIRHHCNKLLSVDARTRLLITLSDGRPDDLDGYRGGYGIEDTRRALIEARHQCIHPYCITIEKGAKDYLSHMYGEGNYALVEDINKLPHRIANIYQRLTS